MTNRTLSVPEIHCGHCKASIEAAASALPGVEHAAVDIDSASVELAYDGSEETFAAIVAAIENLGYEVSTP